MYARGVSGLVEDLTQWPWATIAAFLAAAVTLHVGRSQINERRRLTGREVVTRYYAAVQGWCDASSQLLYLPVPKSHQESIRGFDPSVRLEYQRTTAELVQALLAVQMTCNDAELARNRRLALAALSEYSERAESVFNRGNHQLSEQEATAFRGLGKDMSESLTGFLRRAQRVYAEPSSPLDRMPKWLRDGPRTREQD
ncbi:hypothetical protein [Mycolicibacter hiberniae]|uniref:Uncharacterized protein n=1 Tax=Mycolicibacter hiberniae TaxID=29314 RepID=A0A7I7WXA9_9MYCO|nr:hypothetical protein [Mycolicibacter hiberniae]MCV7086564.1 hypothetical protein [Mycolicibacter hiberniae]BBZ22144.1 hypothetical protein MHIB_05620 [Mycolicibacter hiberniae]